MTRSGFFRALAALFGLGAARCAPQLAFAEEPETVCEHCEGHGSNYLTWYGEKIPRSPNGGYTSSFADGPTVFAPCEHCAEGQSFIAQLKTSGLWPQCPPCKGTGFIVVDGDDIPWDRCSRCGGTGGEELYRRLCSLGEHEQGSDNG